MLQELSIKNFVIIEHETINFTDGLNVITGETGAGKSLVIDAINAIAGERLSKEDIRLGAQKASIQALLTYEKTSQIKSLLEEYGISEEEDNTLLVSREVNISGKSVCRINGQIVTLSMLKAIAENFMDIVGQNEHQLLLNTYKHIDFVDNFIGNSIVPLKDEIRGIISKINQNEKKLKEICGDISERERRLDLISYQINEINSAGLKIEEEEELKNRRLLLVNAERLFKNVSAAYQRIYEGEGNNQAAIDILNDCLKSLEDAAIIDNNLGAYKSIIENMVYQLDDLKNDLRTYRDSIEFNDNEADSIEERLDLINRLKRKYGSSIPEILLFRNNVAKQQEELINSEKLVLAIEKDIKELKESYLEKAENLSKERKEASRKLEKLVERELQDLNMQGARFKISISTDLALINNKGIDKVEFLISPNPGEPEKALSKIASGGEMSRIMLAIKNVLSASEKLSCVVFDEVDAGIGGMTASMVGQKIKGISRYVQAICITHLAQIAAYGDNHILIDKIIEDNKTFTKIQTLKKEHRINEIARMLGGDGDSKASLNHAKELIRSCK